MKVIEDVKKIFERNNKVDNEAIQTNQKRLRVVAAISIPVSLLHIVMFLLFVDAGNADEILWRIGIILAHSAIIVLSAFTLLSLSFIKKNKSIDLRKMVVIQYIYIFLIMLIGPTIVALDQLVTTSITPFLVFCTIMALVFLLRPLISAAIYILTYIFFYFSIGLTQSDQLVLASNRVNGITSIAIGMGLSAILWQYYSKGFFQRKLIEEQNIKLKLQKKELEKTNEKLKYIASHDSLTGLYNRREFERLVDQLLLEKPSPKSNSTILIADIDNFKYINDQYGHPVGDELLKKVSFILKNEIREVDILARWGGEEFVILLHRTSVSDGLIIAERIRSYIENKLFLIDKKRINITVSFGISEMTSFNPDSLNKAYSEADQALYRAKNSGRNKCLVFKE